jgi:hypothetical protein
MKTNRFSQKIQLFIFGLSIGVLIACLFFIFKLDSFFSKVSLFDKERKATVTEELVTSDVKKEKNKKEQVIEKNKSSDLSKQDTGTTKEIGATVSNGYTLSEADNENINVLKEELIGVKNINVRDIAAGSGYKSISDSVLSQLSGISPAKKTDLFMVEFWKTPLNSKGYKMTRNRVLIYGIKENADLMMVKLEDDYYLKNNSEVYRLNYSTEFKPMEKVNESSILQKLNL